MKLQTNLKQKGYYLGTDNGTYGKETEKAVYIF
ncbi:peptidoglycan-binding domain-containing protein [Trichodesmium erythraeum]|nr:peptidoglycan-binding protein [Trichodesmium erythraeum GBRTRLIN201]